jgi:hypothetical protein
LFWQPCYNYIRMTEISENFFLSSKKAGKFPELSSL